MQSVSGNSSPFHFSPMSSLRQKYGREENVPSGIPKVQLISFPLLKSFWWLSITSFPNLNFLGWKFTLVPLPSLMPSLCSSQNRVCCPGKEPGMSPHSHPHLTHLKIKAQTKFFLVMFSLNHFHLMCPLLPNPQSISSPVRYLIWLLKMYLPSPTLAVPALF